MDNDDFTPIPTGFTRHLEKSDFILAMGKVDTRFNKLETTFHGADGKSGIIKDIQVIDTELSIAKGLIKWAIGSSLIGTILTVATLLKLFNII